MNLRVIALYLFDTSSQSTLFKPSPHCYHSSQYNIRQFITAEQEEYFLSKTGDEKKENYDIEKQCRPCHLHLSLGNTNGNEMTAMTVSFSIPSTFNSTVTTSSNQYDIDTNTNTITITHRANVDDCLSP